MPSTRRTTRRHHSSRLAGVGVLILLASACSSPIPDDVVDRGGSDAAAVMSSLLDDARSAALDIDDGDSDGPDASDDRSADDDTPGDAGAGQQQPAPPIKRWLPAEPTGDPAGWQRSPIHCLDRSAAIGSSYVGFAVPGDWKLGGKSGGSGSPRSMGFDYRYRPADLGEVKIAIDSDDRDPDGQLVKYDGQPDSESTFDYDYQLGDDTVRITFDAVGEVPVGDSTADLYIARPEQAPDRLKDVVYRARIDQIDLPQPTFDGGWNATTSTFVIELSYRPDEGEVPEETVKSIVSSLVMPECSVKYTVVLTEMNSQRDVDGDGHISDQQDFTEVLQAGG